MLLIKRCFDIAVSSVLLLVLSPLLLTCAVAIKIDSQGEVFFRQPRLGKNARVFLIFKFRSMINDAAKTGCGTLTHANDSRVTSVGRILRKYRLDELPQLINVLKGEMSLVGPRPLLPDYIDRYSDYDKTRMSVLPGMTGWQQINGGSRHSWEERIASDVWYVEHYSLYLDLLILLRTPLVVIKADSVFGADGWQKSGLPPEKSTAKRNEERKLV